MRRGEKADTILYLARKKHINNIDELALKMHISLGSTSKKINDPEKLTFLEAKRLCNLIGITLDELAQI